MNTMKKCMKITDSVEKKNTCNFENTVAVIVLTYGNFDMLDTTLTSVLRQSCRPSEIIVSDDCSHKSFPSEVVSKFPCVKFHVCPYNLGTVAHMNYVAKFVSSPYIKFISSGDAFYDSNALSDLLSFALKSKGIIVASQVIVCSEDLKRELYYFPGAYRGRAFRLKPDKLYSVLAASNIVGACGTLFASNFFTNYGGFDEDYFFLEDWPTWLRLTRQGFDLPMLNRVTCRYGLGGISSSKTNAFDSLPLRKDMIHCYNKEILPYCHKLSKDALRRVKYNYDYLCGMSAMDLWRKHFFYSLYTLIKKLAKRFLIWLCKIFL